MRFAALADIHGDLPVLESISGAVDSATVRLTDHGHRAASLGLPHDGSTVVPCVSEAGWSLARHALLDLGAAGPGVAFLSIPHRHDHAAAQVQATGRPDWAHVLRTGYARQATS